MKTKLRIIAVSDANYRKLKSMGSAGESFNDVVTTVLRALESLQKNKKESGDIA